MGVNKVIYDGNTLIDISEDTVTPSNLRAGYTAHDSSGAKIVGTMSGDGSGGSGVTYTAGTGIGISGDVIRSTLGESYQETQIVTKDTVVCGQDIGMVSNGYTHLELEGVTSSHNFSSWNNWKPVDNTNCILNVSNVDYDAVIFPSETDDESYILSVNCSQPESDVMNLMMAFQTQSQVQLNVSDSTKPAFLILIYPPDANVYSLISTENLQGETVSIKLEETTTKYVNVPKNGIKCGNGLEQSSDGSLSVSISEFDGNGIVVDQNGKISANLGAGLKLNGDKITLSLESGGGLSLMYGANESQDDAKLGISSSYLAGSVFGLNFEDDGNYFEHPTIQLAFQQLGAALGGNKIVVSSTEPDSDTPNNVITFVV